MIDQIIEDIDKETRGEILGHSEFQIKNFIINQPTPYGKYKQCVLELRSRSKTYKMLNAEIRKIKLKEDKTEEDIKRLSDHEILLEDLERETKIFYDIFSEIKQYINLDDREKLEAEYWNSKFEKEFLSYLTAGVNPPPNLIQTIWNLPKDKCPVVQRMMDYLIQGKQEKYARSKNNIDHEESRELPILTR